MSRREKLLNWRGTVLDYWRFNAFRSPSAAVRATVVRATVVGPSTVRPAIVMEIMAMETVKAIFHEYRIADKQGAVEPRVPPVERSG